MVVIIAMASAVGVMSLCSFREGVIEGNLSKTLFSLAPLAVAGIVFGMAVNVVLGG